MSLVLRKAGTHYEEVSIHRAVTGIGGGSKRSRGSWHVYLRVSTQISGEGTLPRQRITFTNWSN
jgi:hypothetical protein